MADPAEQEPTMEEILASIRRIISEDDEPAAGEAPAEATGPVPVPDPEPEPVVEAAAEPEPEPEPTPEPVEDDEVLELTDRVEDDSDVIVMDREPDPEPTPEPEPEPAPEPVLDTPEPVEAVAAAAEEIDDELVSEPVATAAAGAFGSLISNMMVSQHPGDGLTLEDLVRELLKPMLKDWLDIHLREIVEAQVATEIERIASRARR